MRAVTKAVPLPRLASSPRARDDDDSLLRRWTPVLLRITLGVAVLLMVAGIAVARSGRASLATGRIPLAAAITGDPAALATLGLMVLTLVPLLRVGFCLLYFLRQRNILYVMMTAYVLAVLTAGIFLGRIG